MSRAFTLSFGLFAMLKLSVAQVALGDIILSEEQSDAWISRLQLAPIDLIRDRILLDTNVLCKE